MRATTTSTIRWMTAVAMTVIATSCGDNQSGSPTLPAETVIATSSSTPIEPGRSTTSDSSCPVGEFPAVGALDLATGVIGWSTCSPEEAYRTILGATAEVVLVGQSSGPESSFTIALATADGTELWRRSTPRISVPRGPVAGQDTVVLITDDEGPLALVGVDLVTGDERWRVDGAVAVLGQSADIVVVSDWRDGSLPLVRGIERATGAEAWTSDVVFSDESGVGVARGAAAVWENTIAVPTGSTLTGLDMNTGEELWTASQIDHPDASDGVIVGAEPSASSMSTLAAVDAATGATLWSAPGRSSYGDLLAVGDGLIVGLDPSGPDVIAYELRSGGERWRTTRSTAGDPQLIDGTSLVMLWEGSLAVVSTTDGSTIWSTLEPLGSPLMNSVGTNGVMVFVAVNSIPWGD